MTGTSCIYGDRMDVDVVVVGAGFYALHKLRGLGWTVQGFEAGSGVGGTWYWNRYPGARCDIESMEYSYEFDDDLQQEWEWSERYAPQAEILRYAEHVADRFGLREDIQFDTRVTSATFDAASNRGIVRTDRGDGVSAQFLVMATGCLSSANIPDIEGAATFAGATYHTGRLPHEGVDFTGKRVGINGTGSSAVQSIPIIAQEADDLVVFQRTATYSVPAWNQPLDPEEAAEIKATYKELRAANAQMPSAFGARIGPSERAALETSEEERRAEYEARWQRGGLPFLGAFNDLLLDQDANQTAAQFIRDRIGEIVEDPEVARKLMPQQVVGCKRLCVDTGYYETFNRPNVHLVDLKETPIERVTPKGIATTDAEYEL